MNSRTYLFVANHVAQHSPVEPPFARCTEKIVSSLGGGVFRANQHRAILYITNPHYRDNDGRGPKQSATPQTSTTRHAHTITSATTRNYTKPLTTTHISGSPSLKIPPSVSLDQQRPATLASHPSCAFGAAPPLPACLTSAAGRLPSSRSTCFFVSATISSRGRFVKKSTGPQPHRARDSVFGAKNKSPLPNKDTIMTGSGSSTPTAFDGWMLMMTDNRARLNTFLEGFYYLGL